MRKTLFLVAWITGIIFPMAWFIQQIPGYDQWFARVFASQWMHIAMHAFLYGVLAAGITLAWPQRSRLFALSLALLVGVFQEILQPLPAGLLPGPGALFDLGVDLTGAGAGILTAHFLRATILKHGNTLERRI